MRLWTIQNEAALEQMKKTGRLRADEEHLFVRPEDGPLYNCYCWIAEQMSQRVGSAPEGVRFPVWAWYWWRGKRHKRPDMRCGAHAPRGEKIVRITMDVPDDKVLLSNFDAYNFPFSGFYLPLDENDDAAFEERYTHLGFQYTDLSNGAIQSAEMQVLREDIRRSWDRIFDLSANDEHWLYGRPDEQSIQATLWEIVEDWIIRVEHFIAR